MTCYFIIHIVHLVIDMTLHILLSTRTRLYRFGHNVVLFSFLILEMSWLPESHIEIQGLMKLLYTENAQWKVEKITNLHTQSYVTVSLHRQSSVAATLYELSNRSASLHTQSYIDVGLHTNHIYLPGCINIPISVSLHKQSYVSVSLHTQSSVPVSLYTQPHIPLSFYTQSYTAVSLQTQSNAADNWHTHFRIACSLFIRSYIVVNLFAQSYITVGLDTQSYTAVCLHWQIFLDTILHTSSYVAINLEEFAQIRNSITLLYWQVDLSSSECNALRESYSLLISYPLLLIFYFAVNIISEIFRAEHNKWSLKYNYTVCSN